ncbi:MAG: sigma-54 dependent transcriptional regulator [Proteobacteria bacterium]|nr:sigma-54 dependent transcriptional regulator [Pseudomonadota bacterium]MDA0928863.1 sigma-54 dependent transcriptional regulator [Pseudomonadota bacterium]
MTAKVLIVDDEPDIRELLEITLGRMSLETVSVADLGEARDALSSNNFNLCLTDMRLPDGDGIELVEYINSDFDEIPVAVITAHGSTETAIKALKAGAFDFVSKPVDLHKLRDLVQSALRLSESENSKPSVSEESSAEAINTITGQSPKIRALREQIGKLARSQAPIYISGESGAGKELAAKAIHQMSSRREGPFVAVNCGAISSELMESELFGHLKGSFTGADHDKQGLFQAASGGTLFLDEVADLPLHTQVKLLRVIQEKSVRPVGSQKEIAVDVRLLSATHKNLAKEVEQGRLRQDLYFRINVIELSVPALRERKEDLPALTAALLEKIALENNNEECTVSDSALQALAEYTFPGNVRELENILQRAATLCENNTIERENLEFISTPGAGHTKLTFELPESAREEPEVIDSAVELEMDEDFSLEKHLEAIEIEAIEKALEETRWNKTAAAKKLGMSFRSLRYRLKKLGLE